MEPADFTLHVGEALAVLASLPAASVDCVVTSPPYYGLRDYGAEGQIGLEPTLAEYVDRLVAVFHEARRVLAPSGTCWINLGDSYASQGSGRTDPSHAGLGSRPHRVPPRTRTPAAVFKPKDLLMVPARVALALQIDGWRLRSDVIWNKPNAMPESVTDRPTSSHEHVFLLTASSRYWYDAEAVREPHSPDSRTVTGRTTADGCHENHRLEPGERRERWPGTGRNSRNVWTIATEPYPGAHFAVFPTELARRCIVAGCPRHVCIECGKARERLVEQAPNLHPGSSHDHTADPVGTGAQRQSDCGHGSYRPGLVLDPFAGSGTTGVAALRERRQFVGVELNPEYAGLARERLANWHRKQPRPVEVPADQLALIE